MNEIEENTDNLSDSSKRKTTNNHYVAQAQTRPWILDGKLHFFDFETLRLRKLGSKKLLKIDELWTQDIEDRLSKIIEDSFGKAKFAAGKYLREFKNNSVANPEPIDGNNFLSYEEKCGLWNYSITLYFRYAIVRSRARKDTEILKDILQQLLQDKSFIRSRLMERYNCSIFSLGNDQVIPDCGYYYFYSLDDLPMGAAGTGAQAILDSAQIKRYVGISIAVPIFETACIAIWPSSVARVSYDERSAAVCSYSPGTFDNNLAVMSPTMIGENKRSSDHLNHNIRSLIDLRNRNTQELERYLQAKQRGKFHEDEINGDKYSELLMRVFRDPRFKL